MARAGNRERPAAAASGEENTAAGPARVRARAAEGVSVRHGRRCAIRDSRRCDCEPGYQAQVWSPRDGKPIRRSFPTLAEAKAWRQEAQVALRRGQLRAPTRVTLADAARDWLEQADAGIIRTRSGDPYKPSALCAYRQALHQHLLPTLGGRRLTAITRNHVQDVVDRLVAAGAAPSTVRNAVLPLRAIYARATRRDEVATNPTLGLALPAVRTRRERIVRPDEAAELIAAVPTHDRGIWATALYAGLRRGELQALRWQDVDFDAGLIRVERSWDSVVGPIEPKSRSGRRRVPLSRALRRHLAGQRLQHGGSAREHAFPGKSGRAFDPGTLAARAKAAWCDAGLQPIGLHECRHTYAAFMIAAGVNAKALSTYMGHSTITVTLDRYGHLMPGNEAEAGAMLDTYLQSARASIGPASAN